MTTDARTEAKAQLAALLPRVMADGKLDENEKSEMLALFKRNVLTAPDVRDVFATYLKFLQNEVLEDGLVTEEEQERCRTAVRELRIPRTFLTPEMLAIVDGQPLPPKR
jgi:hypothetical protein